MEVTCGPRKARQIAITAVDYHGSLDAIVPVVRALPMDERAGVVTQLHVLMLHRPMFECYVATAADWSEAYLRWKGLI